MLSTKFNKKRYLRYAYGGEYEDMFNDPEEGLFKKPVIRFNNTLMPNSAPQIPQMSLKKLPGTTPQPAVQDAAGEAVKGAGLTSAIGGFAPLAAGLVDAIDNGNEYGRQKRGTVIGKGALTGAAAGATLGPVGAAAGAVLGAATGFIQSGKQKKAEEKMLYEKNLRDRKMETDYAQAQLSANPSLYQGYRNAEYFKNGGSIKRKKVYDDYAPTELLEQVRANGYALGGKITQVSSDGAEVTGRSHENGGVKIPGMGIELEGNETTKGDYVFSEELGFAKLHKPIMKAKGRIESKPFTKERANSIRLLGEQENRLKGAQEYFKKMYGIIN